MESFELVSLKNGGTSLRSLGNKETFHPVIGPQEEARILHVEQQKIFARAQTGSNFVLWDVGLGAAANALTALRELLRAREGMRTGSVTLHSFDKTTGPLEFALQNAAALVYPRGFEKELQELLETGSTRLAPNIHWHLHKGDFCEELSRLSLPAPDAIFYDPYSAKCNAEMWSLSHFTRLFAKLDPQRPTLLTNYSSATYIRVTLLLAGFYVGYGCQIGEKLHTTIASSHLELLERPLDRDWLENRVRASHSAAAIREIPYQIAPISAGDYQRLQVHPQFMRT
jgi:tRNA U34 5-methylaminomethyl-2-thiouridine-forming methyltransferase MnmC